MCACYGSPPLFDLVERGLLERVQYNAECVCAMVCAAWTVYGLVRGSIEHGSRDRRCAENRTGTGVVCWERNGVRRAGESR